jgi:hypothetical protein
MMTSSDLDAIFGGAGMALDTMRTTSNVLLDGYNNIKNAFGSSRRNFQPNNCYGGGMYGGYGYSQPVSYGYGYADYNCYPNSMYPSMMGGSNYGCMPNNGFMNQGYFGFTDQSYGMGTGTQPQSMPTLGGYDNFYNNSGPKGGAWLL